MTSNTQIINPSQYNSLKGVLPPVEVYAGAGNPYATSLKIHQTNVKNQNELNNQHGGVAGFKKGTRSKKRERRYKGGSNTRPISIVVPQAPTGGTISQTPNSANSISQQAYKTLLDSFVNAQYDNLVQVPQVPQSQGGGRRVRKPTLIKRLQHLLSNKTHKRNKRQFRGKKRRTYKKRKSSRR